MRITTSLIAIAAIITLSLLTGCKNSGTDSATNQPPTVEVADSLSGVVTVLDFQATWCGPCQQMKPVIEQAEQAWAGKVKFEAVDVDENQSLAMQYGVEAIPCLVYLNAQGKELTRTIGYMDYEELNAKLSELTYDNK